MQGYMETGLGDVWQTVTGLAKHVLTHPAARSSAEPAVPDARVGQAGQAMRALTLLHSLPAPPTLLPLPFWDLLGIRIPKTDSEIHEKKSKKSREGNKELIMSPVTVVGISGLVLGELTFLHLHLQVDPLPATISS